MLCCILALMRLCGDTMLQNALSKGYMDRLAVGMSGLCAAHCLATAVLLGLLSSAGSIFENPLIHETGLLIAIVLGTLALGYGAIRHGFMMPAAIGSLGLGMMAGALSLPHGIEESIYTVIGVGVLALGHDLNHRAGH